MRRIHQPSSAMPIDLGRRLLVEFLEMSRDKLNWKKNVQSEEEEGQGALKVAQELR